MPCLSAGSIRSTEASRWERATARTKWRTCAAREAQTWTLYAFATERARRKGDRTTAPAAGAGAGAQSTSASLSNQWRIDVCRSMKSVRRLNQTGALVCQPRGREGERQVPEVARTFRVRTARRKWG